MTDKRHIEIFSAGCPVCQETIDLVNEMACSSCAITIHDMKLPAAAARAKELGVGAVPAVAVNGILASCCAGRGVDREMLRAAGVGRA